MVPKSGNGRRARKTTEKTSAPVVATKPKAEPKPVVIKVKPEPRPKAIDPKKANAELWIRAKAEAHAEIAQLSRHFCACGCGQTTKNTFCPGHDAVLASRRANELFQQLLQHGDTDNASPIE